MPRDTQHTSISKTDFPIAHLMPKKETQQVTTQMTHISWFYYIWIYSCQFGDMQVFFLPRARLDGCWWYQSPAIFHYMGKLEPKFQAFYFVLWSVWRVELKRSQLQTCTGNVTRVFSSMISVFFFQLFLPLRSICHRHFHLFFSVSKRSIFVRDCPIPFSSQWLYLPKSQCQYAERNWSIISKVARCDLP